MDCFGKKIFETLARRVQAAQANRVPDEPMRPVWFAPYESKFCNESGAVAIQQHRVTGERRIIFDKCTYPTCNCDHIKKWYAKEYEAIENKDDDIQEG